MGARWGVGHSAGVAVVGLLALALRGALPIDRLSGWAERVVGVALVGVGLWSLSRAWSAKVHEHEHEHDGKRHRHLHVHLGPHPASQPMEAPPRESPPAHSHGHAAFGIGTLHGLAGSAHLLGVLPALAFGAVAESVAYLAAFGLGTVAAMAAFSSLMGWAAGGATAVRALLTGCGAAAIGVGGWWLTMGGG